MYMNFRGEAWNRTYRAGHEIVTGQKRICERSRCLRPARIVEEAGQFLTIP